MKKNGFTLAEVLITLAIIGVVATLTLPALMTNTQEQQAKTALKKGINTLTEAAQMQNAIAGYDYASLSSSTTTQDGTMSLYQLLADRASVDYKNSGETNEGDKDAGKLGAVASGTGNYVVFFRDGSAISYTPNDTLKGVTGVEPGSNVGTSLSDGLPNGFLVVLDTNGPKGPNILSNCNGNVAANSDAGGDCSNKSKRLIKDQFSVRLRGGYAVPHGPASIWAFNN